MAMLREFGRFLFAIGREWVFWMSGLFSVAYWIADTYDPHSTFVSHALRIFAVLALALAMFRLWDREHRALSTLRKRLGDASHWRRLSIDDRNNLSVALAIELPNGKAPTVRIYRPDVPDCIAIAEDFSALFRHLRWRVEGPGAGVGVVYVPGIRIFTQAEVVGGEVREIFVPSGAAALMQALQRISLPAIFSNHLGGGADEMLTIEMRIGPWQSLELEPAGRA